jgi:hypothetical protein
MSLISDIASQFDDIEDEVIRAWTDFDLSEYLDIVIPQLRWSGRLTVTDSSLLPYLSQIQGLAELTVSARVMESPVFPARPPGLRFLRVTDNSLDVFRSVEGWDILSQLEITVRTLAIKLSVLRSFAHLNCLRIISGDTGVIDLTPLAKLRELRVVQLALPKAKLIRLNPLAEMKDLTIYVPSKVAILGREVLKHRSRVVIGDDFPDFS